jgi:hypothetical protein
MSGIGSNLRKLGGDRLGRVLRGLCRRRPHAVGVGDGSVPSHLGEPDAALRLPRLAVLDHGGGPGGRDGHDRGGTAFVVVHGQKAIDEVAEVPSWRRCS